RDRPRTTAVLPATAHPAATHRCKSSSVRCPVGQTAARSRQSARDADLQNELAQVRVLGEVADAVAHVGCVDVNGLAALVGGVERDLVEHALHYRLQPARSDVL